MKLSCFTILCFFVTLSVYSVGKGNAFWHHKNYYRAAVHEHKQYFKETSSGKELIEKNMEKYRLVAGLAAKNNVDIFIYPEKGLFPMIPTNMSWFVNYAEDIPDGSEGAIPCNEEKYSNSPIIRNLSCIAQQHNFIVVATLIDVKNCEVRKSCDDIVSINYCVTKSTDCPKSGAFKFNTLVAIDEKGTVISRYYKRHPFFEEGITTPKHPQSAYFETEFGLFATDIGFDFLFNNSVNDVKKRPETIGVTYGNWWFDHTPFFYFSVPNQQAWALANKVAVLSSDVHSPNLASLGSGIYIPEKGALVYSYNPDGRSKLLISNVPTKNWLTPLSTKTLDTKFFYIDDDDTVSELNGDEPRGFKGQCGDNVLGMKASSLTDYRCHNTEVEQYTFVKLNKTKDSIKICSNKFCCNLDYHAESMNENFYFAVSGNRLKFYDTYWFGVQACFLARCEPVDGKPCENFILKSNTKFKRVQIKGSFSTSHIYPHILDSELRLTDKKEWNFDGKSQITYENSRGKNLLYCDLYGRKYEEDGLVKN